MPSATHRRASRHPRAARKITPLLMRVAVIAAVMTGVAAMMAFLAPRWALRPLAEFYSVSLARTQYPQVRAVARAVQGRSGEPPDRVVSYSRKRPKGWVALGEVSRPLRAAILLSEDSAFYHHPGYDIDAIHAALEDSWKRRRWVRGASTITQQVAKNLYLSSRRSLLRKGVELLLAMELERTLSKARILEIYFNIAEWGNGTFGIHAATRLYFSKHPSEITPKEAAFLAMLLPSPKRYSGATFKKRQLTPFAKRAIRSVLRKLEAAGYLTRDERLASEQQTLAFEARALEWAESRPHAEEKADEQGPPATPERPASEGGDETLLDEGADQDEDAESDADEDLQPYEGDGGHR